MSEEKEAGREYTTEQKLALLDEADPPEQSVALVARKHGIPPSVMFRWRQLREQGAATGLRAEPLVPASEMKAARLTIRELQRLLGKKTEGERDPGGAGDSPRNKTHIAVALAGTRRRKVKAIARTLGVARSNLVDRLRSAEASRAGDAEPEAPGPRETANSASPSTTSLADAMLLSRVQSLIGERPS